MLEVNTTGISKAFAICASLSVFFLTMLMSSECVQDIVPT
jgi:hypothetical protein